MVSVYVVARVSNRAWYRIALATAVGLVAAACQQAASPMQKVEPEPEPEPPLSRNVAVGLAASMEVDEALASSLRSLGDPLAGLQLGSGEEIPDNVELNTGECTPMLDPGADNDGDGYPSAPTTLDLDCAVSFDHSDGSKVSVVHLGGMLMLKDKDDTDRESGFRSEVDLQIWLDVENERVAFGGVEYELDVAAIASGASYTVSQNGKIAGLRTDDPFLEGEILTTYEATLDGSFQSGTLTIGAGKGAFSFATVPVDCSTLDGAEGDACRTQTSENPGTAVRFAMTATGIAFDKESCDSVITGGYFDVQDDPGNVLRTTYEGCGMRSLTYNGKALSLPEE